MIIHPTALVSGAAEVDDNVSIGPYAVVEEDTYVGKRCEIRSHAVIKRFTSLGDETVVHEGAILGGEPQDATFKPSRSFLRIGARNRIRENVTIHRGTQPESATILGADCFIMANVHIGHNCALEDQVIIASNVALAGHVDIEQQAFISGGVVVHQFCRIGRLAMIGGNSKIVQDCLPFIITDGVPGRARGLNAVGLRRSGLAGSDIAELKRAYRTLLRSGLTLEEALAQLRSFRSTRVDHLIEFIGKSKRGFSHHVSSRSLRSD